MRAVVSHTSLPARYSGGSLHETAQYRVCLTCSRRLVWTKKGYIIAENPVVRQFLSRVFALNDFDLTDNRLSRCVCFSCVNSLRRVYAGDASIPAAFELFRQSLTANKHRGREKPKCEQSDDMCDLCIVHVSTNPFNPSPTQPRQPQPTSPTEPDEKSEPVLLPEQRRTLSQRDVAFLKASNGLSINHTMRPVSSMAIMPDNPCDAVPGIRDFLLRNNRMFDNFFEQTEYTPDISPSVRHVAIMCIDLPGFFAFMLQKENRSADTAAVVRVGMDKGGKKIQIAVTISFVDDDLLKNTPFQPTASNQDATECATRAVGM